MSAPTNCPRCGALYCGTHYIRPGVIVETAECIRAQRDILADRIAELEAERRGKIVLRVEEFTGGMGPDYAEVHLASGQVIQVNDEGFLVWKSGEAYAGARNEDITHNGTWEMKP